MNNIYAIYIIDVTMKSLVTSKIEFWQTYRRFNDFHDLHMLIKKRFTAFKDLTLPGKSLRSSLKDEFLEKRRVELNKYLQLLTNAETLRANPDLLDVMLKFLENKRWENTNNNIKRRFDSILSPMLTSVQNLQSSIKNAPDNMLDMFKGISDNLSQISTTDQYNQLPTASGEAAKARAGSTATVTTLNSSQQPFFNKQQSLPVMSSYKSETTAQQTTTLVEKQIYNEEIVTILKF
jgi:hypothetical protein